METLIEERPYTKEFESALIDTARQFSIDLDGHGFDHELEVFEESMHNADFCEKNGAPVNRRVLAAAALFHDAGFHEDSSHRFKTKEEYSAHILSRVGPWLGMDEDEIKAAEKCIVEATELGQHCSTRVSKCLRRGDLASSAQRRRKFMKRSLNVKRDGTRLNGFCSWEAFAEGTKMVFAEYLIEEDLSFGDFDDYDKNGVLKFITKSWRNIDSMTIENRGRLARARLVGERALHKLLFEKQIKD